MDTLLRKIKLITAITFGAVFYPNITVYALPPVSPDASPDDFDAVTLPTLTGWIIGFTMWVLRLTGVVCTIWGIYEMVTCRKDGDADGINTGIVKFAIGLILVATPVLLKELHILQ